MYIRDASAPIPHLGVSFLVLQPRAQAPPIQLLDLDLGPMSWRYYRCWCIIRCSGRWPLTCYGGSDLLEYLPICHACGVRSIVVTHCLGPCSGTRHLLQEWAAAGGPGNEPELLHALFGQVGPHDDCWQRIALVGRCVHAAVGTNGQDAASNDMLERMDATPLEERGAADSDSDQSL